MSIESNSISEVIVTQAECTVTFRGTAQVDIDGEMHTDNVEGSIVATFNNDGYTGRRDTNLLAFQPIEREQIQAQYFDVLQNQVIPAMKEKGALREDYV